MRQFLGHYISHVPIGNQGGTWKTVVQLWDASSWRHGHTNLNLFLNWGVPPLSTPPIKGTHPGSFFIRCHILKFAPVKASSCIGPVLSGERQVLLLESLVLLAQPWLNEHGWAWLNEHGWVNASFEPPVLKCLWLALVFCIVDCDQLSW